MRVITILKDIHLPWRYWLRHVGPWIVFFAWIIGSMFLATSHAYPAELQKPGSLCAKGLKYDVVKVEGKWRALCYEGDVEEARAEVSADPRYPSSERTDAGCMTCDPLEDFLLEATQALREYNRR